MRSQRVRRAINWMLLAILVIGMAGYEVGVARPVLAQDGDGESEEEGPPLIFGYRHEIVFPAVIRFFLGANVHLEDVTSITLTVRQESGLDHTFTLDLEQTLIPEFSGGTPKQFLFEWSLIGNASPRPFEAVDYLWEVTMRDGEVAQAQGQFYYADAERGLWRTAGRYPLILHWTNANLAGQVVWEEVMAAYGLLDRHTEDTPGFEFALYEPGARLCETVRDEANDDERTVVLARSDAAEYPCSEAMFAQLYAQHGMIFLQRASYGFSVLENHLIETMVRQTYAPMWVEVRVPAWFIEGLAALYRLRPGLAALEVTRSAARTGSAHPIEVLAAGMPQDATYPEQTVWEAQSYLLVLFLADRYGAEAPFQLARDAATNSAGFDGALQALTGDDQAGLWTEWQRWLFSDAAMRAVAWTPYMPTTPTPTPTFTASPLPPTATPSRTPTMTLTSTADILGNPQSTVVVLQLTPTRRPTVTNTPLPPGSLPPAQPQQPSGEGDKTQPDTGVIVGAVGVVFVVGILSGIWILARRHRD